MSETDFHRGTEPDVSVGCMQPKEVRRLKRFQVTRLDAVWLKAKILLGVNKALRLSDEERRGWREDRAASLKEFCVASLELLLCSAERSAYDYREVASLPYSVESLKAHGYAPRPAWAASRNSHLEALTMRLDLFTTGIHPRIGATAANNTSVIYSCPGVFTTPMGLMESGVPFPTRPNVCSTTQHRHAGERKRWETLKPCTMPISS